MVPFKQGPDQAKVVPGTLEEAINCEEGFRQVIGPLLLAATVGVALSATTSTVPLARQPFPEATIERVYVPGKVTVAV
jgi:hypothetical protein